MRFYQRHIPCKVALILDNSSVEVLRSHSSNKKIEYVEDKLFYSLSKHVPVLPIHGNENNEQPTIPFSYRGSMYSIESSEMAKNGVPSIPSTSKKHSSSSRYDFETNSNPKLEKSGQSACASFMH